MWQSPLSHSFFEHSFRKHVPYAFMNHAWQPPRVFSFAYCRHAAQHADGSLCAARHSAPSTTAGQSAGRGAGQLPQLKRFESTCAFFVQVDRSQLAHG